MNASRSPRGCQGLGGFHAVLFIVVRRAAQRAKRRITRNGCLTIRVNFAIPERASESGFEPPGFQVESDTELEGLHANLAKSKTSRHWQRRAPIAAMPRPTSIG